MNTGEYLRRERTLRVALLLSIFAPLATGIAVILSHSTTQLADFIRRSTELTALLVSWVIFRHLGRRSVSPELKARLERTAGLFVAGTLGCSGAVMAVLALGRLQDFTPGGNVLPGLIIAFMGLITNGLFWRRYASLNREQYNTIIDAQRRLYRAKALVDICVMAALSSVAVNPLHPSTHYIDVLGSLAVSLYLLWAGIRTARTALALPTVKGSDLSEEP